MVDHRGIPKIPPTIRSADVTKYPSRMSAGVGGGPFTTVIKIVQNDNNRCNDITSYRLNLGNQY